MQSNVVPHNGMVTQISRFASHFQRCAWLNTLRCDDNQGTYRSSGQRSIQHEQEGPGGQEERVPIRVGILELGRLRKSLHFHIGACCLATTTHLLDNNTKRT